MAARDSNLDAGQVAIFCFSLCNLPISDPTKQVVCVSTKQVLASLSALLTTSVNILRPPLEKVSKLDVAM